MAQHSYQILKNSAISSKVTMVQVAEKVDTVMKTAVFWDVMPRTVYFINILERLTDTNTTVGKLLTHLV